MRGSVTALGWRCGIPVIGGEGSAKRGLYKQHCEPFGGQAYFAISVPFAPDMSLFASGFQFLKGADLPLILRASLSPKAPFWATFCAAIS